MDLFCRDFNVNYKYIWQDEITFVLYFPKGKTESGKASLIFSWKLSFPQTVCILLGKSVVVKNLEEECVFECSKMKKTAHGEEAELMRHRKFRLGREIVVEASPNL